MIELIAEPTGSNGEERGAELRIYVDFHRDTDSGEILAIGIRKVVEAKTGRVIPSLDEFVTAKVKARARNPRERAPQGARFETKEGVLLCWW